jgi:hypothetical protein
MDKGSAAAGGGRQGGGARRERGVPLHDVPA